MGRRNIGQRWQQPTKIKASNRALTYRANEQITREMHTLSSSLQAKHGFSSVENGTRSCVSQRVSTVCNLTICRKRERVTALDDA